MDPIDPAYVGQSFRLMAPGLHIHNAKKPERRYKRPKSQATGLYTDDDPADWVIVTFEKGDCGINIEMALKMGSIVPWVDPDREDEPKPKPKGRA